MEVRPLAAPSAPEVEEVLVLDCPIGMVFCSWLVVFLFCLVGDEVSARGACVNKVGKVGSSGLLRLAYICIYLPYMYM